MDDALIDSLVDVLPDEGDGELSVGPLFALARRDDHLAFRVRPEARPLLCARNLRLACPGWDLALRGRLGIDREQAADRLAGLWSDALARAIARPGRSVAVAELGLLRLENQAPGRWLADLVDSRRLRAALAGEPRAGLWDPDDAELAVPVPAVDELAIGRARLAAWEQAAAGRTMTSAAASRALELLPAPLEAGLPF